LKDPYEDDKDYIEYYEPYDMRIRTPSEHTFN